MAASVTTGRALRYAGGSARGLLHHWMGHCRFAWLTPQQLYRLCSPEMQFYLDAEQQGHEPLSELHFKLAARRRLPELGINDRSWHDAIKTVGEFAATLFLIVTDANRFHPKTPVANPSGYLRAMLQRHRIGTLNLAGSLIGLSERMRRA